MGLILILADDSSVTALDDLAEANRQCEVVDVERGCYTFLNQHGVVLRALCDGRTKRMSLGLLCSAESFSLAETDEHRPDLLKRIVDGTVVVEPGPRIRTREELILELQKCKP